MIDATFDLMEKSDDPLSVTTRQIAAKADVRPAMVNYCFGSRETPEVLKHYIDMRVDLLLSV